jgi:heptosyltransferase-1
MSGSTIDAGRARQLERLLVVRLSAMGDVIHTLPAVAALREAFPQVTIGWLIEERWSELLCTLRYPRAGRRSAERPLVDRVHTVNLGKFRRSPASFHTWQQILVGLSELRGVEYDAAIDFQGAVRSALLARWSGAPVVYGGAQPRENAASMFYTRLIESSGRHVVEQALDLARAVIRRPPGGRESHASDLSAGPMPRHGARLCEAPVDFPIDSDAEKKIDSVTADERFAILNPGAGWGAKQWPVERYGIVAKELARDGLQSLINYGPGEDVLAAAVERASEGAARKISCSIAELVALTRRASLLIGGDTGPMHLAAALKVPVVAIFGPTSPARNGPFGTRSIVLRSASSMTDHSRHHEPEQGLLEITPEEVVAAARRLLREAA